MIKNNSNTVSKTGLSVLLFNILIKIASFFKVSFIIGSYTALFSATSMVIPLAGAFSSNTGILAICGMGLGLKFLWTGSLSFIHLAYHIPGLFAALYWKNSSLLFRVGVPLTCMGLFILNPVGGQAWVYSLYWLVPVVLTLARKKSLFAESLGATFMAHAVGSVIWIYADPMTPAVWYGLVPVVFVERVVFASGTVLMYHAISYGITAWNTRFNTLTINKTELLTR
ncbi:MAG: hypothetical protein NTX86_01155 [Candidatus Dependentiae bacterium]|nr:hypothetical protein [Candidatus Dependentiae bacterium]